MYYKVQLQSMICKWLFRNFERRGGSGGGRPRIEKYFKLLHLLLKDTPEIQLILAKECPYCHKKFKKRYSLHVHLVLYGSKWGGVSRCKLQFSQLLNYISDTYIALRDMIRKKNGKYYVKGCNWYFKTLEEAYKEAMKFINCNLYRL